MQTTSRGFAIDYSMSGDGPPLLLVPGTLCAARQWADFGYTATLERHWRVITVDPLGHGNSDAPHDADSYEAAGVTADLVAVLDAVGVEQATVWGYSRGGWLACNLASRCPDRVERLVIAAYAMSAHEEEADRVLLPLIGYLRDGNWPALWQAFGITDRPFQQMMQDGNDARAVAAAIEGSVRPTRYVDPALIRCPAVYYVGSEDWIVPYVGVDVEMLDATLDIVDGQGHLGSFFDSAQPVLAAVGTRLRH